LLQQNVQLAVVLSLLNNMGLKRSTNLLVSLLQVHYNTDLTHGEFLIKSEVKQAIMGELRAMLARSGNAVVGLARPVLKTTITLVHNALGATKVRLHTTKAGNR
jgi:hypothetical protein